MGTGKTARRKNSEAARAGAEIEYTRDVLWIEQHPVVAKMLIENFADIGARYDRAFIDKERHAAHINLVEQIGGGLSGLDARIDQHEDMCSLWRAYLTCRELLQADRRN